MIQARQDPAIRNAFFFAHKLVFAQRQRYFELLMKGNGLDGVVRVNNFYQDVFPLLAELATQKIAISPETSSGLTQKVSDPRVNLPKVSEYALRSNSVRGFEENWIDCVDQSNLGSTSNT